MPDVTVSTSQNTIMVSGTAKSNDTLRLIIRRPDGTVVYDQSQTPQTGDDVSRSVPLPPGNYRVTVVYGPNIVRSIVEIPLPSNSPQWDMQPVPPPA